MRLKSAEALDIHIEPEIRRLNKYINQYTLRFHNNTQRFCRWVRCFGGNQWRNSKAMRCVTEKKMNIYADFRQKIARFQ